MNENDDDLIDGTWDGHTVRIAGSWSESVRSKAELYWIAIGERYGEAVADLLAGLDDASLFDILRSPTDRRLREFIVGRLGLISRWNQLRRSGKPRNATLRALVPDLRKLLRADPARRGAAAILLLFWWWGARAPEELRKHINSGTPEPPFNLVALAAMRRREGLPERIAIDDAIKTTRLASEQLTQIFCELLDAVEGDEQLFRTAVDRWLRRPIDPFPSRTRRGTKLPPPSVESVDEEHADAAVAAGGESHQERRGEPLPPLALPAAVSAAVSAPEPVTDRPLVALADDQHWPAEVKQLGDALASHRTAHAAYDDIPIEEDSDEAHRQVQQATGEVRRQLATINSMLHEAGAEPVAIPGSSYREEEASRRFLDGLAGILQATVERSHLRIEAARQELRGEFEALQLAPPHELAVASSTREVDAIRVAWVDRLADRRALWRIRDGEDAFEVVGGLPLPRRREIYDHVLDDPELAGRRPRLLEWLISDRAAATPFVPERATRAIVARLEAHQALPPGTWSWTASAAGGRIDALVAAIAEAPLADLVTAAPDERLDLEDLESVVARERHLLPDHLQLRLDLLAARRLPIDQRIARLAAMTVETDLGPLALEATIEALVDAELPRRALLLVVLALKADKPVPIGPRLRDALLAALVDAASDPNAREIVAAILANNPLWLANDDDDIAVLMYLCALTGQRDAYLNLRFTDPESLDEAAAARPVLVRDWLEERLAILSAEERKEGRAHGQEAHDLFTTIEHAFDRIQIHSWNGTKSYKRLFDEWLREALAALDGGGVLPALDEGELYKRACDTGLREPDRSSDARNVMLGYLTDQIKRIERLRHLAVAVGGMAPLRALAARAATDRKRALDEEQARVTTTPALARIYRYAARDT